MLNAISYVPETFIPSLPLAGWLSVLDDHRGDEILLGGTGHLLLPDREEDNVVRQLCEGVLPHLFPAGRPVRACVLTGLAPGSDLLFTRVVGNWLLEHGIPFRLVGLLPVPPETLLADWLDRLREAGQQVSQAQLRRRRQQIEATLAACEIVVDMLPPGFKPSELRRRDSRQRQYRRLAACLAQHSDTLVAILREQNLLKPGGTAEVVHWRRHPHHIPREFSTTPKAGNPIGKRRLVVIDPSVEYTGQGKENSSAG